MMGTVEIHRAKTGRSAFVAALLLVAVFQPLTHSAFSSAPAPPASIDTSFSAPPVNARPHVWWHWMSSNVTREGIDRDLDAMEEQGIGGFLITNVASLPSIPQGKIENSPWPDAQYLSAPWWDLMRRAIGGAGRRGFDVAIVNCPGWAVSGGPWITPERSMQRIFWSETRVKGPQRFSGRLPARAQPQWSASWRDVAVLAVPARAGATVADVLDISAHMQPDGSLAWDAPAGEWVVYRFGHNTAGRMTNPRPDGFDNSLEVDKFSAEASEFHMRSLIALLKENLGGLAGTALRTVHVDSYEAGPQTWTAEFPAQFKKLRGYDPVPWLPVIAGRKLGGDALAGRFLWDMRQTFSDLYMQNHLARMRSVLNEHGLSLSVEPYTGPFDSVAAGAVIDLPMTEVWSNPPNWHPARAEKHHQLTAWVAGGAQAHGHKIVSAEALTGWPIDSRWTEDPSFLKPAVDFALTGGVNQFQLHSWVLQPFADNIKPGMTLSWWGTHFGRNQTWARPGAAFMKYLARCSALLRHGEVVSDYCTFGFVTQATDAVTAELLAAARVENGRIVTERGRRYAALVLAPDTREMLPGVAASIKRLVAAGAVVVGPRPVRSPGLTGFPKCDSDVAAIGNEVWGAMDGATATQQKYGKGWVYWNVPVADVLAKHGIHPDFSVELAPVPFATEPPRADIRAIHRREGDVDVYFVANLSRAAADATLAFRVTGKIPEIWRPVDGSREVCAFWGVRDGRTRLPLHIGPAESFFVVFRSASRGFDPVVSVARTVPYAPAPSDFGRHFIDSGSDKQQSALSAAGSLPDVSLRADAGGRVRLRAEHGGDYELRFASGRVATVRVDGANLPASREVAGAWTVRFSPGMGAPANVTMDKLVSWTESPDKGVKYYSGTATYEKRITISAAEVESGARIMLDLGEVGNLVRASVNGRDLGVAWLAPFVFDITGAARAGENEISLEVTNTWHNRLIGDEQEPPDIEWGAPRMFRDIFPAGAPLARFPDWLVQNRERPSRGRRAFVSWNYFTKDSPLLPSGLLGPVRIRFAAEMQVPMP